MKMRLMTLSGSAMEVDSKDMLDGAKPRLLMGGGEATSVLSLLTEAEARELNLWTMSQPGAKGKVDLCAGDIAAALPDSINLGLWPGWAAVAKRLQAESNDAWSEVEDLMARLAK